MRADSSLPVAVVVTGTSAGRTRPEHSFGGHLLHVGCPPLIGRRRRLIEDAVEHAIDELRRGFRPKPSGQIHGFIHNDSIWRIRHENFVRTEPQNISIRDRHAMKAPILGDRHNPLVQRVSMASDASNQFTRELDQPVLTAEPATHELVGRHDALRRIEIVLV